MAGAKAARSVRADVYIKRQLNGATFLTLEHVMHIVLVVVLAALVCMGAIEALQVWTGTTMPWLSTFALFSNTAVSFIEAVWTIGLVAALVVLAPLMMALDMRTRAEWRKRPGYSGRLAYKAPIYTAIGVCAVVVVGAFVAMIAVVLNSLAMIGVPAIDYGALYLNGFVPALIVFFVFAGAKWYLYKLAKGKDVGQQFNALLGAVAVVLAVALFVTSVLTIHNPRTQTLPLSPYQDYMSNPLYQNLFKY